MKVIRIALKAGRRAPLTAKKAVADKTTAVILGGGAGGLVAAQTLRAVSGE